MDSSNHTSHHLQIRKKIMNNSSTLFYLILHHDIIYDDDTNYNLYKFYLRNIFIIYSNISILNVSIIILHSIVLKNKQHRK